MDQQTATNLLKVMQQVANQLNRMLPPNQQDIDVSAVAYNPGKTFTLYVGIEGNVKGVDEHGNAFDRNFIAGYHPFGCQSIDTVANGTTATDLAACFAP